MALKLVLLVAALVMVSESLPRYIAIPVENVRLVRHVRSAPVYTSDGSEAGEALVTDGSSIFEHKSGGGPGYGSNDHVDYGAYTGGYGAYGWYSDHPVCLNCGYGYHKGPGVHH